MATKSLSEQYLKKVKSLFPYVSKAERKYLDNLRLTLDDFCVAENISDIKELADGFGKPEDIVHEYISSIETDELIRRLNSRKIIRCIIVIALIIAVVTATFFAIHTYREYLLIKNSAIYFEDVTIE